MPTNQTTKEKIKDEFILFRNHCNKTGKPFYSTHDKKLTETKFNEGNGISVSQAKALVKTIESFNSQEKYPTLYGYCKQISETFDTLEHLRTFKF